MITPTDELKNCILLSFDFAAVGALAAADIDQDGDLDLFAAGRTIAGGYPVPTYSRLYEQISNGTWALNSEWSAHLKETGLATSAVFGDIDNDGDQDLILSTEWGPIKIFTNDGSGQLLEGNLSAQLADNLGWWQSILLTDVNNDQQLDIVAGNWGWNGQHGHLEERGSSIRTYYGDFDNNLTLDLIETVFEPYHNGFYPNVHLSKLVQHLPSIQSRTPSHEQFARTRIENLLGPQIEVGDYAEVNTLSSAIFINRETPLRKKIYHELHKHSPSLALLPWMQIMMEMKTFTWVVTFMDYLSVKDELMLAGGFSCLAMERVVLGPLMVVNLVSKYMANNARLVIQISIMMEDPISSSVRMLGRHVSFMAKGLQEPRSNLEDFQETIGGSEA